MKRTERADSLVPALGLSEAVLARHGVVIAGMHLHRQQLAGENEFEQEWKSAAPDFAELEIVAPAAPRLVVVSRRQQDSIKASM